MYANEYFIAHNILRVSPNFTHNLQFLWATLFLRAEKIKPQMNIRKYEPTIFCVQDYKQRGPQTLKNLREEYILWADVRRPKSLNKNCAGKTKIYQSPTNL